MKKFLLVLSLACLVLADEAVKKSAEQAPDVNKKATDRGSDSKPKRDASLLIGSGYHGPSYKYLPPSLGSSVYESYSPGHHGSAGGGFASLGGGHLHHHGGSHGSHGFAGHSSGLGHYSKHSGHSLHSILGGGGGGGGGGIKFSGVSHGFGAAPSYSGGHSYTSSLGSHGYSSGHGYTGGHGLSLGHGSGHAAVHGGGHFAGGHGGITSVSSAALGPVFTSGHSSHGHDAPTYVTAGSLGGGHKVITTSSLPGFSLNAGHVGSAAGFATGYQYAKGLSGAGAGAGYVSGGPAFGGHGFASSPGFAGNEIHHSDHVHNGNQEHHYVVSAAAAGGVGQQDSHGLSGAGAADGYHYETPSSSYLAPSTQHQQSVPSSSYGVPLAAVGASYSPKFHSQASVEDSPVYAAGHKGLGHFSFTANKPNVLHTSFVESDFKTPSYSNAPFKPSTFLGSKFEGSSFNGGESAGHLSPSAQYLPPSGVGAESSGYDYPAPSGPSLVGFQTSHDNGATPIHEPESTYLPPNSLEASFNDNPSANYLPPSGQSYGGPH